MKRKHGVLVIGADEQVIRVTPADIAEYEQRRTVCTVHSVTPDKCFHLHNPGVTR